MDADLLYLNNPNPQYSCSMIFPTTRNPSRFVRRTWSHPVVLRTQCPRLKLRMTMEIHPSPKRRLMSRPFRVSGEPARAVLYSHRLSVRNSKRMPMK